MGLRGSVEEYRSQTGVRCRGGCVTKQKEAPSLLLLAKNGPFKTCPALDNFIQPAPAPPSLNLHPEIRFTATG